MQLLCRRRTVTPEMRAEFARMMAAAPTHEQVMAGIWRVTNAAIGLAYRAPQQRRYAEAGAVDELEFYGGDYWKAVRPQPTCDCPLDPYHRWNCALTPIWAQTMRDLDINPWTVITNELNRSTVSPSGIAILAIRDYATDTEFRRAYEAEKPRWTDLADRLNDHVGGDW